VCKRISSVAESMFAVASSMSTIPFGESSGYSYYK
jgi:hypothetical protein